MSPRPHRRCRRRRTDWPRRTTNQGAYTLLELLVVTAAIALLCSILLPGLGAARRQARAVVCAHLLRQFANGLHAYTGEHRDWIPGLNTSGVAVAAKRLSWAADPSILDQSRLPVQTYDWMTPILAGAPELPALRAERFTLLLERYRCPGQQRTCERYRAGPAPPDAERCAALAPYRAVSYLMSAHFQFVGQQDKFRVVGMLEHPTEPQPITAQTADPEWEVVVQRFLPKLTAVGPPARKVFAADGTRYLEQMDSGELELDVDLHPAPRVFGAFTCAGGWWAGSTAWGVDGNTLNWDGHPVGAGSPSHGQNLLLSYRHGNRSPASPTSALDNPGAMNAAYFDGHVERLRDRASRAPHLWYPSGATVRTPSEGMTILPEGFVLP